MVAIAASLGVGTVSAAGGVRLVGAVGTGHGRAGKEKSGDDGRELHDWWLKLSLKLKLGCMYCLSG